MSILEDVIPPDESPPAQVGDDRARADKDDVSAGPAGPWQTDGRGRSYVKPPEGGNVVYRRGDETVEEALERAARPDSDKKPPKPKSKKLPKQAAQIDLRELETALAQAFTAPGDIAAAFLQDEYLFAHFHARGPYLARTLVNASEHNPWLRKRLVELAAGGSTAMQLQAIIILALAVVQYAIPPVVYMMGLDVPPIIQVAVLGGIVPERARPAPVAQPEANVTPPTMNGNGYAEGPPEAT